MTRRKFLLTALAVAVLSLSSAARAGTLVASDSGSIGTFSLTNMGVSGNVSTVSLAFLPTPPNAQQLLNEVNGAAITTPIAAQFDSPITLMFTNLGGGNYSVSSPSIMKTFGTGGAGSEAQLMFNLSTVTAAQTNFLNLVGGVTSLMDNNLPGYDFSLFNSGKGTNTLTLTTSTGDFVDVLNNAGHSLTGSGSFSEAVPEPASMALLGIGLSGLFTFRRFLKRISVA